MIVEITETVEVTTEVEITADHIISALGGLESDIAEFPGTRSRISAGINAAVSVLRSISASQVAMFPSGTRQIVADALTNEAAKWTAPNKETDAQNQTAGGDK